MNHLNKHFNDETESKAFLIPAQSQVLSKIKWKKVVQKWFAN